MPTNIKWIRLCRSREVKQSYLTSIITTIIATAHSFIIIGICIPSLVVSNGPGTALPILLVCKLYSIAFLRKIKMLFVESFCRVDSLSLTGKIAIRIVDEFVVHWKELQCKYPKAKYYGQLI